MIRHLYGWLVVLSVGLTVAIAQEPAPEIVIDDFWLGRDRAKPAAAAQVVGMADPLRALTLRTAGLNTIVWEEVGFNDLFAPALNPRFLVDIRDSRPMPNIQDRPRNEIPREEFAFFDAFNEALINATDVPLEAFKRSAQEHKFVTFAHLMATPNKFRGNVITVKGRMAMLRRQDPPLAATRNGIADMYQGWVFGPTRHTAPYCIYFTRLPEGLEPAESMNREVTFFGYFLAKVKYPTAEKKFDITPLLVGPTVLVEKEVRVVATTTPFPLIVLGIAICFLMFLTVVFLLMHYWFMRGDRKVRSTLDAIKDRSSNFPLTDEAELPPTSPPDVRITSSSNGPNGNPNGVVPGQLIGEVNPNLRLPEAKPIDPERN